MARRAKRVSGWDLLVALFGLTIAVGFATGTFQPGLQAAVAWAGPHVTAVSQAFGQWFAHAVFPSLYR